jgi:RHS repeat-associated protein/uncharacterized repeat protein (TIGR01451 family)
LQTLLPATRPAAAVDPPPEPQLVLGLSVTPEVAEPGDLVTLTASIENTGGAAATNVVVRAVLSIDLEVPVVPPGWALDGRTLVRELGDFPAGAHLSRSVTTRLRGLPPGSLTLTLTATADNIPEPVEVAATLTVPPPPPVSVIIPVEGGTFTSPDGLVEATFPSGWADEPAEVSHQMVEWHAIGTERGLATGFEMEAIGVSSGEPITHFNVPVTVTLVLSGLVDMDRMSPNAYFIRHRTGAEDPWEWLRLTVSPTLGTVSGALSHFSEIEGGTQQVEGWRLLTNLPTVSTFSGAATYSYPIEVPPGRNGLQPQISLSYNSRQIDGILAWIQSDWLGFGWSLGGTAEIVRDKVVKCHNGSWEMHACVSGNPAEAYDDFRLVLGGTSYRLLPDMRWAGPGEDRDGRFYAEGAPELYVERINDCSDDDDCWDGVGGSTLNQTGEYWIVRTAEGTEYRLGYNPDSEQTVGQVPDWEPYDVFYTGRDETRMVYRWRVDRVSDVWGNEMVYQYQEETEANDEMFEDPVNDHASYLWRITYGGGRYQIRFNRAPMEGIIPGGGDGIFYHSDRLSSIQVVDLDNGGQVLSEVALEMVAQHQESQYDFHKLIQIVPFGLGGEATGQALPETSLGYEYMNNLENFYFKYPYPRLITVTNGYGGSVWFDYEGMRREGSERWHYSVESIRTWDGVAHQFGSDEAGSRLSYEYVEPCFGEGCEGEPEDTLSGYKETWVLTQEPDGGGGWDDLAKTVHHFLTTDRWVLGREEETLSFASDGTTELRRVENLWSDDNNDCPETGIPQGIDLHFVCLKETEATQSDPSGEDSTTTRVTYAYDPSYQGGAQYGQTTQMTEYLNGQAHRRTRRWYSVRDDGDDFLIRQISEGLYEGEGWDEVASTWYYYDGHDQHTDPLGDAGALTRVQKVQTDYVDGNYRHVKTSDVTYEYDPAYGNLITETQYTDYGLMTQLLVSPYTLVWNHHPSVAQATVTLYDEDGLRPVEVRDPLNRSVTTSYDADLPWLVSSVTDPNGATTTYRYDDFGRLTEVFRPGDNLNGPPSRMIGYDDEWRPLLITILDKTDPEIPNLWGDGVMWQRSFYDGLGRLIETQRPAADWVSSPTPEGHDIVQTFEYEGRGLQVFASVPYTVERYVYDGQNPVSPYQEPLVGVAGSETTYDSLGRVVRATSPDGTYSEHHYGVKADGFTFDDVLDPNRHRMQYRYDGLGQLRKVLEIEGNCAESGFWGYPCGGVYTATWSLYATTVYDYDVAGNLVTVTDDAGNLTEIEYDALGRKVEMDDPDMGVWSYEYDAAGNLKVQTDALMREITFDYDALNRLTAKHAEGETLATYSYDQGEWGTGRRTGMADASGSAAWAYDARGRVVTETKTIDGIGTYTTTYGYDAADRAVTMTYPDGEIVTSTYNPQGLAESLAGTSSYVTGASYNAMGQMTWLGLGNDVDVTYQYYLPEERNGRLESLLAVKDASKLLHLSYTYDDAGNVTQIADYTDGLELEEFSYDALDRLVEAERYLVSPPTPRYHRSYEYESTGNIDSRSDYSGGQWHASDYDYADTAHVHAVTIIEGAENGSFAYDANGNMTWRESGGEEYRQVFDAENRLVMVGSAASGLKGWELVIGEVGFINDSLTDQEQTINLANSYRDPVVFAQPISRDGGEAAVARITEVTTDSFTLYVQEAPGLSPGHTTEAVSYLVLEAGAYELEDGTRLEVGTVETDATVGMGVSNRWEAVSFVTSFGATPVILSQVQTERDAHWVKTRQRSASAAGFQVALEEEEAKTTPHGVERIGWLAIESGKNGTVSGHAYKTGLTPDSVTHNWYTISFGSGFTAAPRFVAMIQSYDDPDNCHLRYNRTTLTTSGVQVMIEEDKSQDPYTTHGTEVVGYVAIQGNGSLHGRPVGMTRFVYDEDGNRVLQIEADGSQTAFVGAHYEVWRPGPPPPAPEDLYAVYHDEGGEPYVALGWKPTTAEEGSTFSVYRSATTPVPLDAGHRIASGLTSGSHLDFAGQLGDYYVVTAVNQYGESDPSNTVQAKKSGVEGWEGDPAQQVVAGDGERVPGEPALSDDGAPASREGDGGGGEVLSAEEEIAKYYFLGSQRVAMRQDGVVYYFHTDHLGSTSAMSDEEGNAYGEPVRYLPFGEVRSGDLGSLPTDHGFTGQKHNDDVGLIFMQARYYLAGIGRFVQPDTIIPNPANPQSLNRFSYVLNSPLNFRDPTGHCIPGMNCPGDNPTITVGDQSMSELGDAYQYQELANNCGPANLAMVISLQLEEVGIEYQVSGRELGRIMQDASRGFGTAGYRFTSVWSPDLEGATPPWGMADAHGDLSAELEAAGYPGLGEVKWRAGGTKDELINNIENGVLSTLMLPWKNGKEEGAHYATVVGYDPATDQFLLLDPGTGGDLSNLRAAERILYIAWSSLEEDWSRRPWWFGFQSNVIIETPLEPDQPGS